MSASSVTLGKENLSHLDFLGLYYAGSKDCKRAFVSWVNADVLSCHLNFFCVAWRIFQLLRNVEKVSNQIGEEQNELIFFSHDGV